MKSFRQHLGERKLQSLDIISKIMSGDYPDMDSFFKSVIAEYDGKPIGKGTEATIYSAHDPSNREFVVRIGETEKERQHSWSRYGKWCRANYGKYSLIPKILYVGHLPDNTEVGIIEHLKMLDDDVPDFWSNVTIPAANLLMAEGDAEAQTAKLKSYCSVFRIDPDEFLDFLKEVYGGDLYDWRSLDIHHGNVGYDSNGVLKVFDA